MTNGTDSSQDLSSALATLTPAGARAHTAEFTVATPGAAALTDVTEAVRAVVGESLVTAGVVLISVPHTTCAVVINEDEPGIHEDFRRALERLAPADGSYVHDAAPHDEEGEAPNGYAHIRAALLSASSVFLPVRDAAPLLGRWQRIFLAELDRPRRRTVHVTALGVA